MNDLYIGRIGRKNYFFGLLFFIILFFLGLFLPLIVIDHMPSILGIALILYYLVLVLGYILYIFSLHIRRLHDTGHSGWWILLGPFAVLFNLIKSGEKVENKYGKALTKEIKFFNAIFNLCGEKIKNNESRI